MHIMTDARQPSDDPTQTRPPSDRGEADMYRQVVDHAHKLIEVYVRGFVIFVGISGAVLKFALDQDSTPFLRFALSVFGLAGSALGLICGLGGELLRRRLRGELEVQADRAGLPMQMSSLFALKYIITIAVLFAALSAMGWVVVMRS